jgi:hypothetical protein
MPMTHNPGWIVKSLVLTSINGDRKSRHWSFSA